MAEKRTLQALGGSLYLSLPAPWINRFHLEKGSEVFLDIDEAGALRVHPVGNRESISKNSVILYDLFVFRNLIREYLIGSDSIMVKKNSPFTQQEREQIASCVDRLLNLEIIDEGTQYITIQNLKAEMPLDKMIARMYFLTRSMMEDLKANVGKEVNKVNKDIVRSVIERDVLVGKFYLACIMQQRALLTQSWNSSYTFVEILDLRLLIERIEIIGDEVKALAQVLLEGGKVAKRDLEFVYALYETAYNAYQKKDVQSAQQFWISEKDDRTKLSGDLHLLRIYDAIKDIADLVI